jgi:hypothetical protein
MNRVEWNPKLYSIGVMYEKILKKYTIPQSVSIVEAEMTALYPKDTIALEKEARKIYKLPYVEAATHTFSHPFVWEEIKDDTLRPEFRLKVKGYKFSLEREIKGSLQYINTKLSPKEKANTVFWSGDCMPQEETLAYLYKKKILNINGGETIITNDKPWLNLVAPYGIKRGEYQQVYTGAQNENIYTNGWLGPFWGFKKVIQTFELTENPRRLKPIDIYYHFYAASKRASLNALNEVYQWALKQDTMPIYTSQYIPKVQEFYDTSIAKEKKNWEFYGMKALKTLRINENMSYLNLKNSKGVLGFRKHKEVTYLHLNAPVTTKTIILDKTLVEDANYLIDTNGEVVQKDTSHFKINAYVELDLNYHLKKGCFLRSSPKAQRTSVKDNKVHLHFKTKEATFVVECK